MSHFRVQYAPPADQARQAMPRALRTACDSGVRLLAADPYGHGSTPVKVDADRREATVNGVVVRCYLSNAVLGGGSVLWLGSCVVNGIRYIRHIRYFQRRLADFAR